MVLKRVFEFCEGCHTDLDCVSWDELQYCKDCNDGPLCEDCLPKHKMNAEHHKLECFGKPRKKKK